MVVKRLTHDAKIYNLGKYKGYKYMSDTILYFLCFFPPHFVYTHYKIN